MALFDTTENLPYKAFAVTTKSYAGRGCEVYELDFEDVEEVVRPNGVKTFAINFVRRKTAGTLEADYQYVMGIDEVTVLQRYLACFPVSHRKGRFFR